MKNSIIGTVLGLSIASISLLGATPAYAITAKDRIAIINADGTKESGQSTSSAHLGTGFYEVFWNRDITKCVATVTVGSPTSFGSPQAFATAVQRVTSTGNGHFITITDAAGTLVDQEFMILVSCKTL